jgi:hypothetical protein
MKMKFFLSATRVLSMIYKTDIKPVATYLLLTFAFCLLPFAFYPGIAQVPQGFNYQALAADPSGNPIRNTNLQVKISVLSDTTLPSTVWEEQHSTIRTNAHGIFSLVVGSGVRQPASTVLTFNQINWSVTPLFIKTQIYYQGVWKNMGSAKLWTVPYAMVAGNLTGSLKKLGVKGVTASPDSALFEVKNLNGQTVFAVYNEGVRVYVDDGKTVKGAKGGFAIGGFGTAKGISQNLLTISPDSVRIYVDETAAKGSKGGFAIGGFNAAKGTINEFMFMTPENYFVGHKSGQLVTTGKYNSTLGYESGKSLTTGWNNLFFGYQSGLNNTIGSSNVFIGNAAGFTNSSGNYNIVLGRSAGYDNTSGWGNIILGDYAGSNNTTGYKNVIIGDLTGIGNTTGYQNVFLGANSGYTNTTGFNNVFIGSETGRTNSTGAYNTFMGFESGYTNDASYNSFIGYRAGRSNTTGTNNSFMGFDAGFSNTTGNSNVFIGNTAGRTNTSGGNNVFIGDLTGFLNTGGGYNAFVGSEAGKGNTTGNYNTFFGYQAGFSSGGSGFSTSIGYKAGYSLSDWQGGTYVGFESGLYSTGRQNVFLGSEAGRGFTTGADNVAIGGGAGSSYDYAFIPAIGNRNTFIGYYSGYNSSSATDNVILGAQNPFGATHITGSYNVYLGVDAGNLSATGSRNVFLGYQAGLSETGSDKLYINNNSGTLPLIWGDFNLKRIRFNGNTSINSNPSPAYALQISLDADDAYGLVVFGQTWCSSGAWFGSDIRLKKDIAPLNNALNSVLSLNGVKFNWNIEEHPGMGFPNTRQIGLIAQDVEKVLPELVNNGPDGYKSVDYSKITPVLVEAIKEQQQQIETLKAELKEIKALLKK